MSSHRKWNVTIAGEAMCSRPFSMHDEPEFLSLLKLMRESDITYAHLEMNLGEYDEIEWPARGDETGTFFMADPKIADDLKWAGVDIVSTAFDHCGAYGPSGILSTRKHCKRAGLVFAGTGKDLEEAREPAYLETKKGRVALVAMSSGNTPESWAGLPKASIRGRPGVNPLRVSMKYVVDHETAKQIKEIGKKLGVLKASGRGLEEGEFCITGPGEMGTAANVFVEGDKFEIISTPDQKDLERNCRSVDEAMKMADLVLVSHHHNLSEGTRGDYPPKFVSVVAKACIDAGADMYLGHGWHKTLGIEIYKNKPIFYGLGDFFAQNWYVRRVPYDSYETYGLDMDKLPTLRPSDYPFARAGEPRSLPRPQIGAVFQLQIEDHKLTEIKLYPIEMGTHVTPEVKISRGTGSGSQQFYEGRPFLADRENGEIILERIQRLSATYGTDIEIEDGVGVLRFE